MQFPGGILIPRVQGQEHYFERIGQIKLLRGIGNDIERCLRHLKWKKMQ
jgi:hypothetical protein